MNLKQKEIKDRLQLNRTLNFKELQKENELIGKRLEQKYKFHIYDNNLLIYLLIYLFIHLLINFINNFILSHLPISYLI
jgi:hypothetical protein